MAKTVTVHKPAEMSKAELLAAYEEQRQMVHELERELSECKKASSAFRNSEQCLRNVIVNAPDAAFLKDRQGRYILVNAVGERSLGRTQAELLDKTDRDIFPAKPSVSLEEHERNALNDGLSSTIERNLTHADGKERTVKTTIYPVRNGDGDLAGVFRTDADISDQKRAEKALETSEGRFRHLIETAPVAVLVTRIADGQILFCNQVYADLLGIPIEDATQMYSLDFYANAADREHLVDALRRDKRVQNVEVQLRRIDGDPIWAYYSTEKIEYDGQDCFLTVIMDITEKTAAEAAATAAEARYRRLSEITAEGVFVIESSEIIDVNKSGATMFGYSDSDTIGTSIDALIAADVGSEFWERSDDENFRHVEAVGLHKNGNTFPIEIRARQYETDGHIYQVACVRDVTESKRAREALKESEERFRSVLNNSPTAIFLKDLEGRFQLVNTRFEEWYGVKAADVIGKCSHDIYPKRFADTFVADDKQILETGAIIERDRVIPFADNTIHSIVVIKFPVRDAHGNTIGISCINLDVTERMKAEQQASESEERFRSLVENSPNAIMLLDRDRTLRIGNRKFHEWFVGDRLLGSAATRDNVYPPEVSETLTAMDDEVFSTGNAVEREISMKAADGTHKSLAVKKFSVRNAEGENVAVATVSVDITEYRRAEEQLRQAQKMEAVGQLTGGIAHDFNNLLLVVQGNLELVSEELADRSNLRRLTERAMNASEKASTLTQRLLAFSRKQTLSPEVINLNNVVLGMKDLIGRSLSETIDVEIKGAVDLWHCEVDPAQMETAILNLAINARDAMPKGGSLTIETSNIDIEDIRARVHPDIPPGDYVGICITDTGTGMSPEIAAQVFEPFFTTKEVGSGSGLGLSMVYGFIKQSGGHVWIESEEGKGTSIHIYLPKTKPVKTAVKTVAFDAAPTGNGEMVLVVEDEPDVLELVSDMLGGLGYQVERADRGSTALRTLEQMDAIDVVLTDVVLPGGMDGRELAAEIQHRRPGVRVLFMSGYTDSAIVQGGRLEKDTVLLRKPFRKAEIARTIKEAVAPHPH